MEQFRPSKILDPYELQGRQLVVVASPATISIDDYNHITLPTGMELTVQRSQGDTLTLNTDKIPGFEITIACELAKSIVIEA